MMPLPPQPPAVSETDAAGALAALPGCARILLASHGTTGARAAETAALAMLRPGGHLQMLVVVPDFWRSISGDGWRINASTEHEFCDYLEAQIERELLEDVRRVARHAKARGIVFAARSEHGALEERLLAETRRAPYDMVVIGAPRPAGAAGLRSRMKLDKLAAGLSVPLLVVPHPARCGEAAAR